jgi:acyl CoA:acetate/3-ketoacid CoA transferase alpha subunit
MVQRSGQRSVPKAFVDDLLESGYKELCALDNSGALDKLLTDNVVRELYLKTGNTDGRRKK